MGWFSGKKAEMKTKVIEDPYKIRVTNPLSKFLEERVGKGLPAYGTDTPSLDEKYENAYSGFLSMNPEEWFREKVTAPTMAEWSKEAVPTIEEGWAGGLRGSGRFRDVEESAFEMGEKLGRVGGEMIPSIYTAQLGAGVQRFEAEMQKWTADYTSWLQTLPEFNPILDKALAFLAGPTGRDVISYMDPGKGGKGGLLGAGLGALAMGALSLAIPGAGVGLAGLSGMEMTALGGLFGGVGGSMFN